MLTTISTIIFKLFFLYQKFEFFFMDPTKLFKITHDQRRHMSMKAFQITDHSPVCAIVFFRLRCRGMLKIFTWSDMSCQRNLDYELISNLWNVTLITFMTHYMHNCLRVICGMRYYKHFQVTPQIVCRTLCLFFLVLIKNIKYFAVNSW